MNKFQRPMAVIQIGEFRFNLISFAVALFLLTGCCLLSWAVRAEVVLPEKVSAAALSPASIKLDGERYSTKFLLNSFLQAAVSQNTSRFNNFMPIESLELDGDSFFKPESFKKAYPWLYPFLYEEGGIPSILTMHKWVNPVRISLGLPNAFKAYNGVQEQDFAFLVGNSPQSDSYKKSLQYVENAASDLAPILSSLTNLDIKYVSNEPQNDPGSVSNIRIILMERVDWWKTKYKVGPVSVTGSGTKWSHTWHFLKKRLVQAVGFTPTTQKQVDGYFLSNEKNEIQFSVCYIWSGHEETLLRKLVQECLARALGFSGNSDIYNRNALTVFGLWNELRPVEWQDKPISQDPGYMTTLSEVDQFFIRTLYNPAVKPGMNYRDAFKILTQIYGRK